MARDADPPSVTDDTLREVVRRIRAAGEPIRIVLFGSRARGEARPDSDFDLLIVEESDLPRHKRSPKYYRATRDARAFADPDVDRDIVVWTPEEIRQWETVANHFVTTALREGKVLYERPG